MISSSAGQTATSTFEPGAAQPSGIHFHLLVWERQSCLALPVCAEGHEQPIQHSKFITAERCERGVQGE